MQDPAAGSGLWAAWQRLPSRGWWLAGLFLLVLHGGVFYEGLLGYNGIDAAARLPFFDSMYPHPQGGTAPILGIDSTPELMHEPYNELAMAELRAGRLPLLDPHNGLGVPLLANGQAAPLNPLKLVFLFWHGATGVPQAWYLVSRLWLMGLGGLLLARRLGLTPFGGALVASVTALNGFNTYHFHFPDVSAFVWFPWLLLAGDRLAERPSARRTAVFGLLIGLTGIMGHPEAALFSAGAAWLIALFTPVKDASKSQRAAALTGAALIGIGVAAFTLGPFIVYVRDSFGYLLERHAIAPTAAELAQGFLNMIRTFTRHLLFVESGGDLNINGWNGGAYTFNCWVGAGTLVLCLPGLVARSRARWLAGWLVAIGVVLVVVLPPNNLVEVLPLAPNSWYMVPLFAVALGLLGAAGLDRVLAEPRTRSVSLAAVLALGIGVIIQLQWARNPVFYGYMAHLAGSTAVVVILAALLLAARRLPPAVTGTLILATTSVELWLGARQAVPRLPMFDFAQTSLIRLVTAHGGYFRVAGMLPDSNIMHGLDDIGEMEAFFAHRYWGFMESLNGHREKMTTTLALEPSFQPDLLDLANIRFLFVLDDPAPTSMKSVMLRSPNRYHLLAKHPPTLLYENQTVLPRAWVAHAADFMRAGDAGVSARLGASPARWRDRALIETTDGRPLAGWQNSHSPPGKAEIVGRNPLRLDVEATLQEPGLLVVAEGYDPAWQAKVDGQPASVYPADVDLRAVYLPAGAHHITFRYVSGVVFWSFALSLFTLLLCVWLIGRPRRRGALAASVPLGVI